MSAYSNEYEGKKEMTTVDYAKAIEQTGALAEEVLELKTQELLKSQPELSYEQKLLEGLHLEGQS